MNVDTLLDALDGPRRGAGSPVTVTVGDKGPFTLDTAVVSALYDAIHLTGAGSGVVVLSARRDVSTTQAAELLGMSRHSLLGALTSGALPFHMVGSHRRIRLTDVMDLRRRLERDAGEAASAARYALSREVLPTNVPRPL